nr:MAG TPA: hypothetical protein [Crassvirales sp.]
MFLVNITLSQIYSIRFKHSSFNCLNTSYNSNRWRDLRD